MSGQGSESFRSTRLEKDALWRNAQSRLRDARLEFFATPSALVEERPFRAVQTLTQ
jgi:hypothetical protein